MGRRVPQKVLAATAPEGLDSVRASWYRRFVREGDPPDEALRKAKAWTPARERMRAVDPG